MDVPPEIAFRNVESTPAVEDKILEGIEKLEKVYDRLVSVRIMVENQNPGRESGQLYHVRVDMGVPGNEIVVHRRPPQDPQEDLTQAVGEAFDIARRRLRKFSEKQRGEVKTHEPQPHGRVLRLFPGEDYGFIGSEDDREIYFHRNSVVNGDFEDLEVGTIVRFAEERGEKGPQASSVYIAE
ncbi:MAG: HPF/RaiA family ribosome-associated protein [Longimicrobiales bacterium]|nr:HPF/RaiA family ribosome-associated protein [Longimicrobiales bacterium]